MFPGAVCFTKSSSQGSYTAGSTVHLEHNLPTMIPQVLDVHAPMKLLHGNICVLINVTSG